MYAILDSQDTVIGMETRDLPIEALVHEDFYQYYIQTNDILVEVGDQYDRAAGTFRHMDQPSPVVPLTEAEQMQLEMALNLDYLVTLADLGL